MLKSRVKARPARLDAATGAMLACGTFSVENPVVTKTQTNSKTTKAKLGLGLIAGLVSISACGTTDPEAGGAGDAYRNEAGDMPLDEVVTGEIDMEGGDTTDWKAVTIEDAGKVTVQLATDKDGAAVAVEVFDKYGQPVASGSKKGGSDKSAKVQFKSAEGGRYFIRIRQKDGGKTTYSVQVSMGDGGGGGGGPDI